MFFANELYRCREFPDANGANRIRLRFASMAHAPLCARRRLGLAHTRFAAATCGSLRLEPLKIAAWVRIGVRRIEIAMDTNHPFQDEFHTARRRLSTAAA